MVPPRFMIEVKKEDHPKVETILSAFAIAKWDSVTGKQMAAIVNSLKWLDEINDRFKEPDKSPEPEVMSSDDKKPEPLKKKRKRTRKKVVDASR